jgi:hypothetical protein
VKGRSNLLSNQRKSSGSSFMESTKKSTSNPWESVRSRNWNCDFFSRQGIKKFHEYLKKQTGVNCGISLINDLKDLRLEHDDVHYNVSLEFLKQQKHLQFLSLYSGHISDEVLNMIWEMEKLESLKLRGFLKENGNLNNIHKLQKLKRLIVDKGICSNILDHLKFGVFEDLEEMAAWFRGASEESVRKMKRITPNLRKIEIWEASSETINALLETLENLESVKIADSKWRIPRGKVYPKIKYFDAYFNVEVDTEYFPNLFPNLEYFNFDSLCYHDLLHVFFIDLLRKLRKLKIFHVSIHVNGPLNSEAALRSFQCFGGHLKDAKVNFLHEFAVEKRPGGSYFIKMADYPSSYWDSLKYWPF